MARQIGEDFARGVRPGYDPLVDDWPQLSTQGSQHFASEAAEASFLADTIWPRLDVPHQALMQSQQGPVVGILFTCMPISSESGFSRKSAACCSSGASGNPSRCHRPSGHHRAACSVVGVLERRVCPWRAHRQGFAERQADLTVNVRPPAQTDRQVDNRRLEVVVEPPLPPSGERNWPSTPRWTLRSAVTEPGDNAPRATELRCCRHEGAKRGHTQSSPGPWGWPDWWCSVARSEEGGPRRPAVS